MRDSSNGKTSGFQPENIGSIPISRSNPFVNDDYVELHNGILICNDTGLCFWCGIRETHCYDLNFEDRLCLDCYRRAWESFAFAYNHSTEHHGPPAPLEF